MNEKTNNENNNNKNSNKTKDLIKKNKLDSEPQNQNSNLGEGSKSYHEEADIYERFSQVEDSPKKILNFLKPLIEGKKVLDLGCGTGKFMIDLAHVSKEYVGLDISKDQLNIAKNKLIKNNINNVKLIQSSAENIPLESNQFDVIISTWVLGTIQDESRREKAVSEALRLLKTGGSTYLVENNSGGDFEVIRNRFPNKERTEKYNSWLLNHKFIVEIEFNTYFEFNNLIEAQKIFEHIWGKTAMSKIKSNRIKQKIIIFKQEKK
ncbi:class I SAM-dependent methyltransferase [Candidatus Woesearchaeota archaeon]|jgi:ubiquinone/menaquinone biosynthesis C-methylase UbiE|nr:class I SAM-dependent methyltransferase [Candidatus Woesearchaeota archaeon]